MKNKYILFPHNKFFRKSEKFIKKDISLKKQIKRVLSRLENNPFISSLETHKVLDRNGDKAYSSRVTDDLRIIWNFQKGKAEILDILDIGGHSGKNKVYR